MTRVIAATLLWMIRVCAVPLLWLAGSGARAEEPRAVSQIEVVFPGEHATIGGADARGFIAGRATSPAALALDVVLAIDTSFSIAENGDLVEEIAAARAFVAAVDLHTTRVGIVSFAGDEDATTPDAFTEVPLTGDPAALERGLTRLERNGGKGMTNLGAALELATNELLGSAKSMPRVGARRVMIVLTDEAGPTLPVQNAVWRNEMLCRRQAERSEKVGVRIDVYAFGELPKDGHAIGADLAKASEGVFVPVKRSQDLAGVLAAANLSGVEKLEIVNRTTEEAASSVLRRPDGFFAALVPLRVGANTVQLRGEPGGERTLDLTYETAASDDLPPDMRAIRTALSSTEAAQ